MLSTAESRVWLVHGGGGPSPSLAADATLTGDGLKYRVMVWK